MKVSFVDFVYLKENLKLNTKTKILSSSMEPFIYKDEIVEVSPAPVETIKVGDAIVFWADDILVCHFVTKIITEDNNIKFITKGLSNKHFDRPVLKKFYLGKLTSPKISQFKKILFRFLLSFKRQDSFDKN